MTSKARTSSAVVTNLALNKIVDQDEVSDATLYPNDRFNFRGNILGDATVAEIAKGGWYPNTQSALMQLLLASVLPIGSILSSTDASNPFTTQQFEENISFNGISEVDNLQLYGVSIPLEIGDGYIEVTEKVFNKMLDSQLFDMDPTDHVPPSNNFVLRHKSSRPHHTEYTGTFSEIINPDGTATGITAKTLVTGTSGSDSLGYGEWELFHTDPSTFSAPVYYYRRIA